MHEGHRLRMYEKLKKSSNALEEHELLEILLFNALPRINTNPLAHRLLDEFGSIERIFSADVNALMQVEGVGAQLAGYLKCISLILEKYDAKKEGVMPKKYQPQSFVQYLKEYFSQKEYEVFNVYVLDDKGKILLRKTFTDQEENSVTVPPRALTQLTSQYAGKFFILAHNHIKGTHRPSAADDELTVQIELLCSINNVRLLDHFIYANGEIYSYYQSGKMADIARSFHISQVLVRGKNN